MSRSSRHKGFGGLGLRSLRWIAPVALAGVCAGSVLAQDGGGVSVRLGLSQDIRSTSNPGLDNPSGPRETQARTALSFGLISETPTQRLALSADGAVEAGQNRESGLVGPKVNLSYSRDAATSGLALSAFLQERDVDTLDFFLDPELVDAEEPVFTTVAGTGTRRQTGGSVTLDWGRDAPLGVQLGLRQTRTDYIGTTDPSLIENRRTSASLGLRFDLAADTRLNATLTASQRKPDGLPATETQSLSFGLTREQSNGTYDLSATVTRSDSGNRESLSFGRSLSLPSGSLALQVGVSTRSAGGTGVTASASWQQDLPRGQLGASLSRRVTSNDRDAETEVTQLSLSLSQELGPRLSGQLGVGLQDSAETGGGASSRTLDLSASLRYDLTEDWGLSLGANRRDRNSTTDASSTSVFMNVSRNFDFRF